MVIHRWHVSRKLGDERMGDPAELDVTITPAGPEARAVFEQVDLRSAPELPVEKPRWWSTEDDLVIEGSTTENALVKALINRNVRPIEADAAKAIQERGIVEDMVLLQFVHDGEAAENYQRLWDQAKRSTSWPDVTALVSADGATWVDYTQPSRAMAQDLYTKLLEQAEPEEGTDAT